MRTEPPGPAGLPLVGNSYHYARDPFTFMSAVARAYGDVVSLSMGPNDAYLLSHPDDVERILVREEDRFVKGDFGDDAIDDLLGHGLLRSEGDFWRQQRSVLQPAFNMGRIREMADGMVDRAVAATADWADGDRVDVERTMQHVTVRVITDVMFDVELGDDRVEELSAALELVGRRFEPDPRRQFLPSWVPTADNREFHDGLRTLDRVLDDVVRERRQRGDLRDGDDVVALLYRAREDPDVDLTQREMRDELMTMLLAGHDTTALSLTYTTYLLATHPGETERLHAELDDYLGDDRPGFGDLPSLGHTERVIEEAMRLYPPVYSLFRQPVEDVQFQGYTVPEGSILFVPQWVVHRDERWWDDPETYDPDRFTEERSAGRPDFAYFPFGGGSRHCIGQRFSMMEARLILATLYRDWDLTYVGEEPLDLRGSITMHPQNGMPMRVHRRET